MEKKKKSLKFNYLQAKYTIVNSYEKKTSKPILGRVSFIDQNSFWMEVPSVETDGMHISFGGSTFIRNKLELQIHTTHPVDQIHLTGEVEWYELIPSGKDYRFNVGVSISDISETDKKKYTKLVLFYKENMTLT